jgi:hypothetical protein
MSEIWKDIEGFEGLYQISNLGNVKSLNYRRSGKENLLSPTKCGRDYFRVKLGANNERYMHRLVAKHFIPNPENKPEVNHIDGDKSNNCVLNLEWCTPSENKQHAYDTGLKVASKGEKSGRAKLTNKQVGQILYLYKFEGFRQKDLAEMFQCTAKYISCITRGEYRKDEFLKFSETFCREKGVI